MNGHTVESIYHTDLDRERDRSHQNDPMGNSGWLGGRVTWFALIALCQGLGNGLIAGEAAAAEPVPVAPAVANAALAVISPTQRAPWQQKLSLGPGDVLTFSLYGEEKELTRKEIPVGPDGRLSYLEAQNIMAAGLTVDELRGKINEELGKYRRAPRAYVAPMAYKSKKFHLLGKVAQPGAYLLQRPTTLFEAVVRARGIETRLAPDGSRLDLADLWRSFIVRGGRKLPVDFEKLFRNGDLAQNIALEPGDYIYFPETRRSEVFVLGAVRRPGAYALESPIDALGALAARGGFAARAWKQKLLVIRGALRQSETFIVNASEVVNGSSPHLRLQPGDIVYVGERPWVRAEELLDAAATAFVTLAAVEWTGAGLTSLDATPASGVR
jgi:polysaccharide biosynthesis/export protein